MPTYEYACRECGRHLEVVQSFTEKPLTKCPSCKGALKKVFSPVGIVLKGSGFYRTDSRPAGAGAKSDSVKSESGSGGSEAGGSGKAESSSSGEAKTADSKSDKKPEKKPEKKSEKKTDKSA